MSTVLGMDVSHWDGAVNFEKARSRGVRFVFIKASQGRKVDPHFAIHWKAAGEAGLLRGAYHYLDFSAIAELQAEYFCSLLANVQAELPPVVDYEEPVPDGRVPVNSLSPFLEYLIKEGFRPMVYTSLGYWKSWGSNVFFYKQFPLWIAAYTTSAQPSVPPPWSAWTFWQTTAKASGPDYGAESKNVDLDVFNGGLEDLYSFAGYQKPEEKPLTIEERLSRLEARFEEHLRDPGQFAVCQVTSLNVRQGPGVQYSVVGMLRSGQRVKIVEHLFPWVRLEDPAGWVNSTYLSME